MAKSLSERLTDAVANLTTLEVITRVGPIRIQLEEGKDPVVTLSTPADANESGAYTRIDLVDGDTLNNLSPDFVNGPYADLRTFHLQAVKDAQDLVNRRIDLIERVAKWMAGEIGELSKLATTRPADKPPALSAPELPAPQKSK